MKKSLRIIIASAIFVFLLAGCTGFSSKVSSSKICSESNNNSSKGTYDFKFSSRDESETQTIYMQGDGKVRVKFSSMVKKGKVYFTLKDSSGKIIHEDSGKKFSFNESFSLEKGLYQIVLDYEKTENGNLKLEVFSDSYFEYRNGNEKNKDNKDDK